MLQCFQKKAPLLQLFRPYCSATVAGKPSTARQHDPEINKDIFILVETPLRGRRKENGEETLLKNSAYTRG